MELTRENCINALNDLSGVLATRENDKQKTKEYINILEKLIEEHFDNKELKNEMDD